MGRRLELAIVSSVIGFCAGFLIMGYLSVATSRIFLETARINYVDEQEALALEAQRDNDLDEAVCHYSNVVAAKVTASLHAFRPDRNPWSVLFPVQAMFLLTGIDKKSVHEGGKVDLGIAYGKLAKALEGAGQLEAAEQNYEKAQELIGMSRERVRTLLSELSGSSEELQK